MNYSRNISGVVYTTQIRASYFMFLFKHKDYNKFEALLQYYIKNQNQISGISVNSLLRYEMIKHSKWRNKSTILYTRRGFAQSRQWWRPVYMSVPVFPQESKLGKLLAYLHRCRLPRDFSQVLPCCVCQVPQQHRLSGHRCRPGRIRWDI